jgi:hypothetical protein
MTQHIDLADLSRRPLKHWSIDGIPEITMGGLWILWGASMLLSDVLPPGNAADSFRMMLPFILVISALALNRLTKILKARITEPRAGRVVLPSPSVATRIATAAIAAIAAAGLVGLIATGRALAWEHLVTSGVAIMIALALVVGAVRTQASHLLWLAGFALLLGAWMFMTDAGTQGFNWMLLALGGASAVLGTIRLRQFLHHNPRQTDDQP